MERDNSRFEAPAPKQLQRLTGTIMSKAVEMDRLRKFSRLGKACFFVDETEFLQDGRDDAYSLRHRLAARVAKQTIEVPARDPWKNSYDVGISEWHLQMYDTQWYEQSGAEWIGLRSLYRFAWNNRQVTQAERSTITVPRTTTNDMGDHLEKIDVVNREVARDDFIDILHAENEYQTMRAGDVDELMQTVDDYFKIASR